MNDLRHDPDALEDDAPLWLSAQEAALVERSFLRQWQPVPPGVKPWGRTVMHKDGATYTNVDPPAPEPPDLRTVGDRVAECEQAIAALWDDSGHTAHKLREVMARLAHVEALLHKALNPGEQEGGE